MLLRRCWIPVFSHLERWLNMKPFHRKAMTHWDRFSFPHKNNFLTWCSYSTLLITKLLNFRLFSFATQFICRKKKSHLLRIVPLTVSTCEFYHPLRTRRNHIEFKYAWRKIWFPPENTSIENWLLPHIIVQKRIEITYRHKKVISSFSFIQSTWITLLDKLNGFHDGGSA